MEQTKGENEPRNPEQILKATAVKFNELDLQAKEALRLRDSDDYRLKLQQRAELIVSLPSKIKKAIELGETFPSEEMGEIQSFSFLASEMLRTNNSFGLGTLLTDKGSKIGDPNNLEQLINRVYPPKNSSKT